MQDTNYASLSCLPANTCEMPNMCQALSRVQDTKDEVVIVLILMGLSTLEGKINIK